MGEWRHFCDDPLSPLSPAPFPATSGIAHSSMCLDTGSEALSLRSCESKSREVTNAAEVGPQKENAGFTMA